MLTYTSSRNLYGKLTNNESSANLLLGDTLINAETRRLLRKLGSKALERTTTFATGTSVQYYAKPARMKKIKNITITTGTTKWPIKESPTREHWDKLNQTTGYTSSIPEWFYSRANDIGFWPIPANNTGTVEIVFDILQKDLGIPDYSTGTITTATNGTTQIIGSGTNWTSNLAGLFLRISGTAVASNIGDHEWYEISSVTNGTTLVLARNYEGANISSGTATYVIGQVSLLPDGYHELPVYRATSIYYSKIDQNRYQLFKSMADSMESELFADAGSDTMNVSIEETDELETTNPNLQITL